MFKMKAGRLIANGFWGVGSNLLQTVLLSLFFIVLARMYDAEEFAIFLVASSFCQLISSVSSLGLSVSFGREYMEVSDPVMLSLRYLKLQVVLGFIFYFICLVAAMSLYADWPILKLVAVLGAGIISDNVIQALRTINVLESKQRLTVPVVVSDNVIKFGASCLALFGRLPIFELAAIMTLTRLTFLPLLLKMGTSGRIRLADVLRISIGFSEIRRVVSANWVFAIIGSISIIFWRVSNIIIAKQLGSADVANYEVSFRIFSVYLLVPVVLASTVFPRLVRLASINASVELRKLYEKSFLLALVLGLLAFVFVLSWGEDVQALLFGEQYARGGCLPQMFLTALVFPVVLLQANLMVVFRMEKADMYFNVVALVLNVGLSLALLCRSKDLALVNYSTFVAFLVFSLLQVILLVRRRLLNLRFWSASIVGIYLFPLSVWFWAPWLHPLIKSSLSLILATVALGLLLGIRPVIRNVAGVRFVRWFS